MRYIDKWVRRKLRCYLWKQLGAVGLPGAAQARGIGARSVEHQPVGPWRLSKTPALTIALPLSFFTNVGLPNLSLC